MKQEEIFMLPIANALSSLVRNGLPDIEQQAPVERAMTEQAAVPEEGTPPPSGDDIAISAQAQKYATDAQQKNASAKATENDQKILVVSEPPTEYRQGTENTLSGGTTSGSIVEVSRKDPARTADKTDAGEQPAPTEKQETAAAASPAYETTLTKKDGGSLSISFTDNVVMQEAENGETSVYFKELDLTRTYGVDGSVLHEAAGNTLSADTSSIIINVSSGSVNAGNGDNLIFNWANDTQITAGSGDDTIILADNVDNISIATGDGADKISGSVLTNSSIDLGEGDNVFQAGLIENSDLRLGNGNNTVQGTVLYLKGRNSTISLGDGDNILKVTTTSSAVSIGNGNNNIVAGVAHGTFAAGDGNNIFALFGVTGHGSVTIGNGNNRLNGFFGENAKVQIGDGNNTLFLFTNNNARTSIGNGNNNIKLQATDNSTVSIGNGDNAFFNAEASGNAVISVGGGNNFFGGLSLSGDVVFEVGGGDNKVAGGTLSGSVKLIFGDGNNLLFLNKLLGNAVVQLGNGENCVYVNEMEDDARLEVGDGNTTISVGSITGNASISTGKGGNVVVIDNAATTGSLPPSYSTADIRKTI